MPMYEPVLLYALMCHMCGRTIGYADPEGKLKKIGLDNFPYLYCSPKCAAKGETNAR